MPDNAQQSILIPENNKLATTLSNISDTVFIFGTQNWPLF